MDEDSSSLGATGNPIRRRPHRLRLDQEKRKLQNRESQRTYRQKQKKNREDLKQSSRPEQSHGPRLGRPLQPKQAVLGLGNAYEIEISSESLQALTMASSNRDDRDLAQISTAGPGEAPGFWFSNSELGADTLDEFSSTTQSLDMTWSTSQPGPTFITPQSTQLVSTQQYFHETPFFNSAGYFDDLSTFHTSLIPTSNNESPHLASSNANEDVPISQNGTLSLLQVPDTVEHRFLLASALQQNHSIGSIFLAGLRSISNLQTTSEDLPDVYGNNLSLRHLSTMQAYLSNAHALLFDVPSLMHPFAPSPFHQAHITTVAAAKVYISTLPESLPPHLRPTPAQIIHAHLPFLDLLPFPTLRERAITLASVTPPLIDLRELKVDILNDGLVCWGGTNRGGQPWDMRTWEATSSFLRKWWILVGGESDEIREGARWWRRLRGEEVTRFHEEP